MNSSSYVTWLQRQGIQLYKAGNEYWRMYRGALVTAPATICYVNLQKSEALSILKESGAKFVRYSSNPCTDKTRWWNIVCDKYNITDLSSSTRSKINRGHKRSLTKRLDAEWIAHNGYNCYVSAFNRYLNAVPLSEDQFHSSIAATIGGPFEYWGVFLGDDLAGYCQCILEHNEVATSVFKYDPSFLKFYTSYSLLDTMLTNYVLENNLRVSNGSRSVAHDTDTQDFLLKFGFVREYCHLNIVYQPAFKLAVQSLYPLRKVIYRLPRNSYTHKIQSILFQEELFRSF